MSIVDLPTLSPRELILHYILSCRNDGITLPYSDFEIIETWLREIECDADSLLLILSDILPKYFASDHKRKMLKGLKKTVSQKIKQHLLTKKTGFKQIAEG